MSDRIDDIEKRVAALESWRDNVVVCPECGPTTRMDEDGCCVSCGTDLWHDENGERTVQAPEVYDTAGFGPEPPVGEPGEDRRTMPDGLLYVHDEEDDDFYARLPKYHESAEGAIEEANAFVDRITAPLRAENERLRSELSEADTVVRDIVQAMELWGSWEDGIPEAGDGAHGSVGSKYDRAVDWLGEEKRATDVAGRGTIECERLRERYQDQLDADKHLWEHVLNPIIAVMDPNENREVLDVLGDVPAMLRELSEKLREANEAWGEQVDERERLRERVRELEAERAKAAAEHLRVTCRAEKAERERDDHMVEWQEGVTLRQVGVRIGMSPYKAPEWFTADRVVEFIAQRLKELDENCSVMEQARDGFRRLLEERDAEVERLTKERDEARAAIEAAREEGFKRGTRIDTRKVPDGYVLVRYPDDTWGVGIREMPGDPTRENAIDSAIAHFAHVTGEIRTDANRLSDENRRLQAALADCQRERDQWHEDRDRLAVSHQKQRDIIASNVVLTDRLRRQADNARRTVIEELASKAEWEPSTPDAPTEAWAYLYIYYESEEHDDLPHKVKLHCDDDWCTVLEARTLTEAKALRDRLYDTLDRQGREVAREEERERCAEVAQEEASFWLAELRKVDDAGWIDRCNARVSTALRIDGRIRTHGGES